jgi:hypothetical protein
VHFCNTGQSELHNRCTEPIIDLCSQGDHCGSSTSQDKIQSPPVPGRDLTGSTYIVPDALVCRRISRASGYKLAPPDCRLISKLIVGNFKTPYLYQRLDSSGGWLRQGRILRQGLTRLDMLARRIAVVAGPHARQAELYSYRLLAFK